MKRIQIAIAASLLAAAPALAEPVVPDSVEFVDGAVAVSLSGTPGNVENGKVLMNKGAGNCIACHAVTDLSNLAFHGEIGPILDGVADRWSQAELRGIIANPKMMFEGTMMPAFYRTSGFTRPGNAYTGKAPDGPVQPLLTAQEVEDVVAYLMTLKEQ